MQVALKHNILLIKDPEPDRKEIIKSWPKAKWNRNSMLWECPADLEILTRLKQMCGKLPEQLENLRKLQADAVDALDKERFNENPVPFIKPPVKVKPFAHQIRGYNMALMVFGLAGNNN